MISSNGSASKVVPNDARDEFWSVVKHCLREFHKLTVNATRRKTTQCRKKIEGMPKERVEFFYHSEPFDVACDIAKHSLKIEKHFDRYLQIRDERQGDTPLKQVLRRPRK